MSNFSSLTSIDGLASNLQTTDIVNRLIELEKRPQDILKQKLTKAQAVVTAYQSLNTKLQALQANARDLGKPGTWTLAKATSTNTTVASAAAAAGAPAASLAFTVNQLASGTTMISSGSVPSLLSPVYSGNLLLSTAGAQGFSSLAGNAALALGAHTINVTQSTAAATKTGTAALAANTVITTGSNDTINLEVDGVAKIYTIAASGPGGYTAAQLAAAVQTASGGELTASLDGSNQLVLKTVAEGSLATVKITAGNALGSLFLGVDGVAIAGVDGSVTVDGTANTISSTKAGISSVLTSGTGGTVTAFFASGLRTGTVTATNVDTGDGTLQSVTAAINAANVGINASAVQPVVGSFRLQLSSSATGAKSTITIPTSTFGALGTLQTLTAGQDATLTVGTGPAAYTVSSASNSISNVLSGVTITAATVGSATVNVAADANALADRVQGFATQMNEVLNFIKTSSTYNAETKVGGPLLGSSTARTVVDRLLASVGGGISTSSLGNAAAVGLSTTRDGTVTFDKAKFLTAYAADPKAVQTLFAQGGTATSSKVAALNINDRTQTGTAFPVVVTQAAEQAKVTGTESAALSAPETIDVKVGTSTVSYSALAGASIQSIADGLNAALQSQKLGVVATVQSGFLVLSTPDYGATVTFEVRSNASGAGSTGISSAGNVGAYVAYSGKNVIGTINGVVTTTGVGQILTAPIDDPLLAGLSLRITATPADVVANVNNFGTFTVINGVAQLVSTRADASSASDIGTVTTSITGRKSEITDLNLRIADWDRRLITRQAILKRQFTAMERALSSMKSQSQWLAGQVSQMQATTAAANGS